MNMERQIRMEAIVSAGVVALAGLVIYGLERWILEKSSPPAQWTPPFDE